MKPGPLSLFFKDDSIFQNKTGLNSQLLTDMQKLAAALLARTSSQGDGMTNSERIFCSRVVSADGFSSRISLLMRHPALGSNLPVLNSES